MDPILHKRTVSRDSNAGFILYKLVHECRNWEGGRAVSFLKIFVSNFRYSVFAVCTQKMDRKEKLETHYAGNLKGSHPDKEGTDADFSGKDDLHFVVGGEDTH
jgi:hypothetical protein